MRHMTPLPYIPTPYIITGSAAIPDNELDVAWDLYRALQSFYRTHPHLQQRPLVVTGEVRSEGPAGFALLYRHVGPLQLRGMGQVFAVSARW